MYCNLWIVYVLDIRVLILSSFVIEFFVQLKFSKHEYSFKENSGLVKITLVLSKPLSSGFDITIISAALTPTFSNKGEYISKYAIYVH